MKLRTRSPLWRRVVRLLGRQLFRLAENNEDGRMEQNGEGWLLRELIAAHVATRQARSFVAIDGGANAGDYSRFVVQEAARVGANVEVHAFEPSPRCVRLLRKRFAEIPGVRVVAAGLADRKTEATLYAGDSGSGHASLVPRDVLGGGLMDRVTVPLLRLDEYLNESAISRVDLLKLDIEGFELAALRGLAEQLTPKVVDTIQFEYGGAALDAGTTLRELYRLLEAKGYVVTKLFPSAVEVRSYRDWMEHYAYSNYVALSPRWLPLRGAGA